MSIVAIRWPPFAGSALYLHEAASENSLSAGNWAAQLCLSHESVVTRRSKSAGAGSDIRFGRAEKDDGMYLSWKKS